MQDTDFLVDGRVKDGSVLQTVAERFIVEHHLPPARKLQRAFEIPVEDEFFAERCGAGMRWLVQRNLGKTESDAQSEAVRHLAQVRGVDGLTKFAPINFRFGAGGLRNLGHRPGWGCFWHSNQLLVTRDSTSSKPAPHRTRSIMALASAARRLRQYILLEPIPRDQSENAYGYIGWNAGLHTATASPFPMLGIFHRNEVESMWRHRRPRFRAVAQFEYPRDIFRPELSAADIEQSAHDFADHVAQERLPAHHVEQLVLRIYVRPPFQGGLGAECLRRSWCDEPCTVKSTDATGKNLRAHNLFHRRTVAIPLRGPFGAGKGGEIVFAFEKLGSRGHSG